MATQYDPIAKDGSLNTTEAAPRNIADVLAEELSGIASALTPAQLASLADVTISSPSDGQTLKYDSITQKWVNANDAGGHTIENPSGTDMTQRANLQFVDAGVSDDSVNDRTEIEVLQEIASESDLSSAPDGVYQGTWDESVSDVFTADMVGYGTGTVKSTLDCSLSTDGLSFEYCTYKSGGYAVIGNMVVVNLRITNDGTSNNRKIYGLPQYTTQYQHVALNAVDASSNTVTFAAVSGAGVIAVVNNSSGVDTIISGVYIKG